MSWSTLRFSNKFLLFDLLAGCVDYIERQSLAISTLCWADGAKSGDQLLESSFPKMLHSLMVRLRNEALRLTTLLMEDIII